MRRRRSRYQSIRERAPAGPDFYRNRREKVNMSQVKEVITWIWEILLVIIVTAVFVNYFCFVVTVLGPSMEPTLDNGDKILMDRFFYQVRQPRANDLIVFSYGRNQNSQFFVKRVIGVPGDTVQIVNGRVLVNDEPFREIGSPQSIENALVAQDPVRVGEDEYFVLGDNRNNSEDSRFAGIGNVKIENIRGRAWFRIFPLNEIRFLR